MNFLKQLQILGSPLLENFSQGQYELNGHIENIFPLKLTKGFVILSENFSMLDICLIVVFNFFSTVFISYERCTLFICIQKFSMWLNEFSHSLQG